MLWVFLPSMYEPLPNRNDNKSPDLRMGSASKTNNRKRIIVRVGFGCLAGRFDEKHGKYPADPKEVTGL